MVYDNKTLMPLHKLSKKGEIEYRKMLESEADKILYRHFHPIRYRYELIRDYVKRLLHLN